MNRPVWLILLGAIVTILTAWTLGRILLRALRLKLYRVEEDLFALLTGSAILSLLVFLLGLAHLAQRNVFIGLCVVSMGVAYWLGALRPSDKKLPPLSRPWLLLFALPLAFYSTLYFFNALAPSAITQLNTRQLANVVHWWVDHGFAASTQIPRGLGMLFVMAFSVGRLSAAALVHLAFLATLPLLILFYGRRFGSPRACILGGVLLFASPIMGVLGTGAYDDLANASVLFGLFYLVEIWMEEKCRRFLVPACLLAAFATILLYATIHDAFLINVRKLPALWSLNGAQGQGLFGPWLMLCPLAIVAVQWKHGRRLLLAAAICAPLLLLDNATRAVIPMVVFLAPALGLALQNSPGMLPLLLILHSLTSWPGAVQSFAAEDAWRIKDMPVKAALRLVPQDEYLAGRVPGYLWAQAIEESVPREQRVLSLAEVPQAYTSRRLSDESSDDGKRAVQAIHAGYRSVAIPLSEIRFHFAEQPVRAVRVTREGSWTGEWSVAEMRVFRAGVEVERRPDWRVNAEPDSGDAPRAFDNSEVTAWPVSGAGAFLEEDFSGAISVDSVLLIGPILRPDAKWRIEVLAGDGQWKTLAQQVEVSIHATPSGLRHDAAEELKSLGFGYVIARHDSEAGADMHQNQKFWGITCIRDLGGACVYRLD